MAAHARPRRRWATLRELSAAFLPVAEPFLFAGCLVFVIFAALPPVARLVLAIWCTTALVCAVGWHLIHRALSKPRRHHRG